jgi:hypothetical protein
MRFPQFVQLMAFNLATLALHVAAQNLSWSWSNPQPHGNDIVGMAWNGTLGVQVCELGRIYTSPDLVNWFSQNSGLTNDLQAVTFFGNRIIISGANGAIAYSDDGVNFTNCSVNTTNWLVSVAASSNLVVAVGDNGSLYTSPDGANWNPQSGQPSGANQYDSWLTSVTYGNGVFVTTGDTGDTGDIGTPVSYIANSSDGIHWTNQTSSNYSLLSGLGNLEAVAWVNTAGSSSVFPYTGFWAVDDAGHAIYSTNNGISWKKYAMIDSTNVLYAIAADNVTGLLAGDSEVRLGSFLVASNHIIWPEQTGPALTAVPPWTYFAALSQTNGSYELAGYDGQLVQSYVTNGTYNWSTPYYSPRDWLFQVATDNGIYVAVGDNVRVLTSDNGADWDIEEVPLTNSVSAASTVFLGVGGSTNLLFAVGSQGSLAASPNFYFPVVGTNTDGSLFTNKASSIGVLWYSLSAPAETTNDLAAVCSFGGNFYLVADGGKIFTLKFTNWTALNTNNVNLLLGGANWTIISSPTTNDLAGITVFTNAVYTNGLLVACGDKGCILSSTDGISWNATNVATTGLLRVRSLNARLLALGENGMLLTSTNGTGWTKVPSGVTNWLNDAVMVGNNCYVVGNQGVVLTSTNFTNWTSIGTITGKSLDGVATQNGQLVAVGFEGTILQSQVVPVTTPVNFTEYAQSDDYNIFSVAGTLDQQFTLDSSTNLVNWVTGPALDLIYGDGTLIFYQNLPGNPPANQYYRCTLK